MAKRRGNKEGSIYQRANGKWQAQVSLDGRRLGKTVATRKDASEWVTQMSSMEKRGLTFQGTKTTFGEYLAQWLIDTKPAIRQTTLSQYQGVVTNYVQPKLGRVKLSELSPRLIQNLYSGLLEQGKGKRTVQVVHAVIHRSLKFAMRQGLIATNPAESVQKPKHSPARMQVLSEKEIQGLLAADTSNWFNALLQLAVTTGLRKGELLGLIWADIDFTSGTIRVERQLLALHSGKVEMASPKTETGIRTVKIGPRTVSALGKHLLEQDRFRNSHLGWNEENLVFPSASGTRKSPRNLVREFKAVLQKAGLPNIRFHDLRHTAASLMLMTNMPIVRISRQLGHAKPSTTLDIYGHLIPGLETDAVERIEKLVMPIATELQPK